MSEELSNTVAQIAELISKGQLDAAAKAIWIAHETFEQAQDTLVYAGEYVRQLKPQLAQFSDFDAVTETLEEYLLNPGCTQTNNLQLVTGVLANLGATKHFLGLHEEAIRLLEAAINLRERTADPARVYLPHWVEFIGLSYRELGDFSAANLWDSRRTQGR